MNLIPLPKFLNSVTERHPYPLLFATISGAHLYGFPSPDSDYDLRGAHILSVADVIGFDHGDETIGSITYEEGIELDLVSHDIKKFFPLMLKKNGYVLEQLYSPLVVHSTDEFLELREIGKRCITRHHSHHYNGFARTQWRLLQKQQPPKIKPLLYVYRVLLTGIYLMRTGIIEANILTLNEEFRLPYIESLVQQKQSANEKSTVEGLDMQFHTREYERLLALLQESAEKSTLPIAPSAKNELNDLLKRLRLKTV